MNTEVNPCTQSLSNNSMLVWFAKRLSYKLWGLRTRIYVTDISRWREIAAVHSEVFGDIRPAATMVEVAALIAPELLVEIEADAYSEAKPPTTGGNEPSAPGR